MRMSQLFARAPEGALGRLFSLSALVLPLALNGVAFADTFKVDGGSSKIQFVSDAPLEKFTGSSSGLSGEITVDPAKPADAKGDVKVDVASIKTGVSLRDEHLHGDGWLDAAKFPQAKFTISKVSGITALKPGETAEGTVSGKFTLHGVTKDITAQAKVRHSPTDNTLHVIASFKVKLEEYKVSIPSIVALKVAPEVLVNVDLNAKK